MACMRIVSGRHRGFTLLELVIVLAIVSLITAIVVPEYQRHVLRAKAAGVVVGSAPVVRAIQEVQQAIGKSRRLYVLNGADGSISGCPAPEGSTCAAAGAVPAVIVKPELLLITGGTIRISAAPCYVDCPGFALNFSSDLAVPGTPTPPGAPAGRLEQTNRVLYEFGESMRGKAYASDNAACLFSAGTCAVTVRYR